MVLKDSERKKCNPINIVFTVKTGPHAGLKIERQIDPLEMKIGIGRSRKFTQKTTKGIHLAKDLDVSSTHATIVVTAKGHVTIEDHSSTNGTYLNDIEILPNKPQEIKSQDTIQVGESKLQFSIPSAICTLCRLSLAGMSESEKQDHFFNCYLQPSSTNQPSEEDADNFVSVAKKVSPRPTAAPKSRKRSSKATKARAEKEELQLAMAISASLSTTAPEDRNHELTEKQMLENELQDIEEQLKQLKKRKRDINTRLKKIKALEFEQQAYASIVPPGTKIDDNKVFTHLFPSQQQAFPPDDVQTTAAKPEAYQSSIALKYSKPKPTPLWQLAALQYTQEVEIESICNIEAEKRTAQPRSHEEMLHERLKASTTTEEPSKASSSEDIKSLWRSEAPKDFDQVFPGWEDHVEFIIQQSPSTVKEAIADLQTRCQDLGRLTTCSQQQKLSAFEFLENKLHDIVAQNQINPTPEISTVQDNSNQVSMPTTPSVEKHATTVDLTTPSPTMHAFAREQRQKGNERPQETSSLNDVNAFTFQEQATSEVKPLEQTDYFSFSQMRDTMESSTSSKTPEAPDFDGMSMVLLRRTVEKYGLKPTKSKEQMIAQLYEMWKQMTPVETRKQSKKATKSMAQDRKLTDAMEKEIALSLKRNPKLYEDIVLFKTLELAIIRDHLSSEGNIHSLKNVTTYLDKHHIAYK